MSSEKIWAAIIVIGNEILSGRTQDKNVQYLAAGLNAQGIQLAEVRIIPDNEDVIIATINTLRKEYTYVFTTGGIGPTHDDITSLAVAKAFGVELHRDPEAVKRLRKQYTDDTLNEARLKMAEVPKGAQLIDNPVSQAPGFRMENVFVLAGVPRIMQAMFDGLKYGLKGGAVVHTRGVSVYVTEGNLADDFAKLQQRYAAIDMGSYPFIRDGKLGTSLVLRGSDVSLLEEAYGALKKMLSTRTSELIEEEVA